MPELNCAFAAGCNAAASPTASALPISFFIVSSFRVRLGRRASTAVPRYCCIARISFWICARWSACGLQRATRSFFWASWALSVFESASFLLERSADPAVSGSRHSFAWAEPGNAGQQFAYRASLERLQNSVVRVRRKNQVLRKVHFHTVALPNRDGRRYLHEAVNDRGRGLRNAGRSPVRECLGTARCNRAATLGNFARSGNHAQGYRSTEDLKVVVVYLILHPFLSDLIETLELVEVDGVAVRHNQAVKHDGHPALLAKARRSDLLSLAQHDRPFGNDDVLMIVRIQRVGDKGFNRTCSISIQPIHKNGVENRSLVDEVGLTCGQIEICF